MLAADPLAQPDGEGLSLHFGKPTWVQRLHYRTMYEKKPFRDAVLYYDDNGLYKIISPGEAHYGSYVIDGSFDAPSYKIHYIALPSTDWNNTSAYHVLVFDRQNGRFTQQAITPEDGRIAPQEGDFSTAPNTVTHLVGVRWDPARNGPSIGTSPAIRAQESEGGAP